METLPTRYPKAQATADLSLFVLFSVSARCEHDFGL